MTPLKRLLGALVVMGLVGCSGSGTTTSSSLLATSDISSTTPSPTTRSSTTPSSTAPTPTAPSSTTPSTAPGPDSRFTIDEVCLVHDSAERCAEVFFPERRAGTDRPILLDLHGWGSDPGWQRARSGFEELAVEHGFVAAWPAGLANSFNAGGICCPPATENGVDDVGFLRSLVAELAELDGHHDGRVYVTGLSNGCAMAQRFAVEAGDLVDAVACFAFYLLVDPPPDPMPVPVMEIHAVDDPIVSYEGRGFLFPGARENIETWAAYNGCDVGTGPVVEARGLATLEQFRGCTADTVLVTLTEGGHLPYPSGNVGIDTTRIAWEFLSAHG